LTVLKIAKVRRDVKAQARAVGKMRIPRAFCGVAVAIDELIERDARCRRGDQSLREAQPPQRVFFRNTCVGQSVHHQTNFCDGIDSVMRADGHCLVPSIKLVPGHFYPNGIECRIGTKLVYKSNEENAFESRPPIAAGEG
jgi:hypothetical protein